MTRNTNADYYMVWPGRRPTDGGSYSQNRKPGMQLLYRIAIACLFSNGLSPALLGGFNHDVVTLQIVVDDIMLVKRGHGLRKKEVS